MSNAPERIWLQWSFNGEYETFSEAESDCVEGISWCADQLADDDAEYIRADLITENGSGACSCAAELRKTRERIVDLSQELKIAEATIERMRSNWPVVVVTG